MNNTKINAVTISHWPNKGALMLQGPEEATNKLDERLKVHMRGEERGSEQGGEEKKETSGAILIYKRQNITLTKDQIDDMFRFVRNWGRNQAYKQKYIRDGSAHEKEMEEGTRKEMTKKMVGEAPMVVRGNKAIRSFEREISRYLRTRGFALE